MNRGINIRQLAAIFSDILKPGKGLTIEEMAKQMHEEGMSWTSSLEYVEMNIALLCKLGLMELNLTSKTYRYLGKGGQNGKA